MKKKNYIRSEAIFKEVIRSHRDFAEAYNALGTLYGEKGEINKAIEFFEKSIEINPDSIKAHINLDNSKRLKSGVGLDWWDWWTSSKPKSLILLILGILAAFIICIIFYFSVNPISPFNPIESATELIVKNVTSEGNISITTTNSDTFSSKLIETNSFLVLLGIIIVIILSPQMKKVKVGPFFEFEKENVQYEKS